MTPQGDRNRSTPLPCHAKGDNKAWSNIGIKIYITMPTYVNVVNHQLGTITCANRAIARPAAVQAAVPAPKPAAVPAGANAGADFVLLNHMQLNQIQLN